MRKHLTLCALILIFLSSFLPVFAEEYTGSALFGRLTLLIPDFGSLSYDYEACLRTASGSFIESDDVFLNVSSLPDGVSFDPSDNTVTVFDNAKSGDMFTISISSEKYPNIKDKSYTVRLTDNMIVNSTFSDLPTMSGWESSYFKTDGATLKIGLDSENGTTYILTQKEKLALQENRLYELSFEIRTTSGEQNGETKAYSEIVGSSAVAYCENPYYPSWTHITVPVRPSEDGEYIVSLVFMSEDDASVLLRNPTFTLSSGTPPVALNVSVPQSINVPTVGEAKIPFFISASDIEGNTVPATLSFDITPKTEHITIDSSLITVSSSAEPGTYKVLAYASKYPDVNTEFSVTLTRSGISNGSFEESGSDSLWFAPGDGVYEVIKENGNSYAAFTPNAEIGVMYNNAYVSFSHSESYVFSADLRRRFSDKSAFVTFIVEDSRDPDNLQLCAYFEIGTSWQSYKAVFTPESDLSGRFIVAVNVPDGFDEQTVYLDNISVVPAEIKANNVKITGIPERGRTLSGTFEFVNNFDGESASVTNWLLADSADGEYKALSNSNVSEIEVTEDMEGKFLIFEVTPISLTAGIVGDTVRSTPVKIPKKQTSAGTHRPGKPEEPEPEKPPARDGIKDIAPVTLTAGSGKNVFSDCENHWANDTINSVYDAGIISGYSKNLFKPDKNITRAEFCAFLMRSLSLEEGVYSGEYADVSPQSWYAGVIQTMLNCGIVKGVGNENFAPNAPVTREQITVMIMRAYSIIKPDMPKGVLAFSDNSDISDYAVYSVAAAAESGIVKGNSENMFLPGENATRAEAIVMLARFLEAVKK